MTEPFAACCEELYDVHSDFFRWLHGILHKLAKCCVHSVDPRPVVSIGVRISAYPSISVPDVGRVRAGLDEVHIDAKQRQFGAPGF